MKPDIVYVYNKSCSGWMGREIIFSIRSLEKFGKNYNNVVIVGDKPEKLNDAIIHIPKSDFGTWKERKICEKLLTACKSDQVTDPFVFFNDDFFLVKPIDFSNLKYFYFDNLGNKIQNRKIEDTYKRALKNTRDVLFLKGLVEKHFDIHYPMIYHKAKFTRVMEKYDWNIRGGYVIKSLYANSLKIVGKSKKDCKIYVMHRKKDILEKISATDLFSTDEITRAMIEIFHELYPAKSSFEI